VKDAHIAAQRAGTLGTMLHRLFREAMSAGKAARSRTRIGEESASIATAALDLARQHLGTLDGRCIAIVGAGKMGRAAVRRLRQEHARDLLLVNRSTERAQELIAEAGFGRALALSELDLALEAADVVVTSTGGTEFLLDAANVSAAMARRSQRPLFIIDIAVPRDVDPEVAAIHGITLVDVDGLRSVVDEKLEVRREAIPAVEAIIVEYLERFQRWYGSQAAVPAIASLTRKAEAIREAEIARLFTRCPDLTKRERTLVIGMSMTIVSRLLHSAITKIRDKALSNDADAISHARVLDELFELDISQAVAGMIRERPGEQ
jgi:glutamyl-tRNA reductase